MKEYINDPKVAAMDDSEESFVIVEFVAAYTAAVKARYTRSGAVVDLKGPLEQLREKSAFGRYARLRRLLPLAEEMVETIDELNFYDVNRRLRSDLQDFFE